MNDKYYPTFVVEMRKDGLTGVRYGMNEMLLTQYGAVSFSNNDCRMFAFDATAWGISSREELSELLTEKKNSENPVSVLYRLNIPIETDLPPEIIAAFKQLHTNYPTTIITNNADAGMELTYTVDTQSYVDGKIAEINMQVVNTQKQLLQERSE